MLLFPGPTARAANVTDSADDCVEVSSYESASINLVFKINRGNPLHCPRRGKAGSRGLQPDVESRTISLSIPGSLLPSLSLKSSNEAVSVGDLSFASLSIENNNGDIDIAISQEAA